MIFLAVSILCSVIVSILLKLAKRYKINVIQAVTWNYAFAILMAIVFFKPQFTDFNTFTFSPVYALLGILLPLIFWFLAASVRHIGIVRTDIAQRLSLFIPLIAAYLIFNDQFSTLKISGLVVGFLAIFLTLNKATTTRQTSKGWIYPIIVFLGFGTIDILFKQVAQIKTIPYTSSLILIFSLSFIISILSIVYLYVVKKQKIELINLLCGCILGFFNFLNILFYLKAHRAMSDNPSTVFASMNLGVIILGTLTGVFIFKEKLNKQNYLGLALALVAIILITLSQVYAI
ncbi:MAG: EamA/RhaT family transporter [Pedobacter sp.]|nr:MAG: EamA/RhaT family transporter [Pedobacter sp.]